jgi:hypothetical protein
VITSGNTSYHMLTVDLDRLNVIYYRPSCLKNAGELFITTLFYRGANYRAPVKESYNKQLACVFQRRARLT